MAKPDEKNNNSDGPQARDDSIDFVNGGPTEILVSEILINDKGGAAKWFYGLGGSETREASVSTVSSRGVTVRYDAETGMIVYDLESAPELLAELQALGAGASLQNFDSFTYTLRIGNGAWSTGTVYISFTGANDTPEIVTYYGPVTGGDTTGPAAVEEDSAFATGAVVVKDADTADTVSLSVTGVEASGELAHVLAANGSDETALLALFALQGQTTGLEADHANGGSEVAWTFDGGTGLFDFLRAGTSLTLTYALAVQDDSGAANDTGTGAVTIVINGVNDEAIIGGADTGAVTEDTEVGGDGFLVASGKLVVSDVDYGEAYFREINGEIGALGGSFSIDADGNWTYRISNALDAVQGLGAGATATDAFTVKSADGTEHTVTITVNGVNDEAIIGGSDTGSVTEDDSVVEIGGVGFLVASGKLVISDADYGEAHFETVSDELGTLGGFFSIDADGNWTYRIGNASDPVQKLNTGQSATDSFTFRSIDGSAEHTVTITVNGVSNDGPSGAPTANPDRIELSPSSPYYDPWDGFYYIPWSVFLENDTDAETPDELSISDIPANSGFPFGLVSIDFFNKTVVLQATGAGSGWFDYEIEDGHGLTAITRVDVTFL